MNQQRVHGGATAAAVNLARVGAPLFLGAAVMICARGASLEPSEITAALRGTWVPVKEAAGQVQAVVDFTDSTVAVCGLMSSSEGKRFHAEVSEYSVEGGYLKWRRHAQCTSDGASPAQFVGDTVESSVYVYRTADGAIAFSWPGLDLYTRVRDGRMSITTPDGAITLERKAEGASAAAAAAPDPAVAAAIGGWEQAWNLGVLEGIMSWYDPEYRTEDDEGLGAVEEWYRGLLAEGVNKEVKIDKGKMAIAMSDADHGAVTGLVVTTPEGESYRLKFGMRRRPEGWRIAQVDAEEVY